MTKAETEAARLSTPRSSAISAHLGDDAR